MKTDAQLQQDVQAELRWEPALRAPQMGVEVEDGVVTLVGNVSSHAEKLAAEAAALRVTGVKALAVAIEVKLSELSQRTDTDIARSVHTALEWNTFAPKVGIKAMVEGGWVTLSGEVDWQFQKQAAEGVLRFMVGVTGVSNHLVIKPKLSLTAVKSDIEAALQRRAAKDSLKIIVAINGSDITLSGTVSSADERKLATSAAWGTPGVHNVIDSIELVN